MDNSVNASVPADDAAVLSQALNGLEGENPTSTVPAVPVEPASMTPTAPEPPIEMPAVVEEPAVVAAPQPEPTPVAAPEPTATLSSPAAGPLDDLRQTAITELQSLIGRVELKPTDKFDAYLMLIRSTDDTSLIAPAHDAALAITDEEVRTQALINIIKEIDYLTHRSASV